MVGDQSKLGRFLRYGDGYSTYICPIEKDRYTHPDPTSVSPPLDIPSCQVMEQSHPSVFVHLCAPSGPLHLHPPHPEELVLETLNCYPEYKNMPFVEWNLRLLSLSESPELAPMLGLDLALSNDDDENDKKKGTAAVSASADRGSGSGERTEALWGETILERAIERVKKEEGDKIHVLLYTIENARISSYCTIPWKSFIHTFVGKEAFKAKTDAYAEATARRMVENHIHKQMAFQSSASAMEEAAAALACESAIALRTNPAKKRKPKPLPLSSKKRTAETNGMSPDDAADGEGERMEEDSELPGKKKRRVKVPKDPHAPKRNIGAYSHYMKHNRKLIQEANPKTDSKDIVSTVLFLLWFHLLSFSSYVL